MKYGEYEKRAAEFHQKERELYADMRERLARREERHRAQKRLSRKIGAAMILAFAIGVAGIILLLQRMIR